MGGIEAEITILGCGGSGGTPLACGHWGNCDENEPKNRRTRASIAIRTARTTLVIDTGPDFREQSILEGLSDIDGIVYTHDHADHVGGFDDVRYAAIKRRINGDPHFIMPVYADEKTMNSLQKRFDYMFEISPDGLYIPLIKPNLITTGQFQSGDITIDIISQIHGAGSSLGFKIGDIGYSTDASNLDDGALQSFKGIKAWIVDCGQYGSAEDDLTVHPNLERVLRWNDVVGADRLYLTHLTPRQDYHTINAETADNIECAYDGLKLKTTL